MERRQDASLEFGIDQNGFSRARRDDLAARRGMRGRKRCELIGPLRFAEARHEIGNESVAE